ncbi:MAG: hypothetical protein IJD31_05225 [Lachnospiraceae bacterium]|nr:hypothetical protein [Lachnospiraceae bacterium]
MEGIVFFILPMTVPLIFLVVGIATMWKAGKKIYRWTHGCKKVMSTCIEIQEFQEDGVTVYRPIYEYNDNGVSIKASKLDYDYEKKMFVNDMVPIIVEKKHPDVVMEVGQPPSLANDIVIVVVGAFITFFGFQAAIVIILSNLMGVFSL